MCINAHLHKYMGGTTNKQYHKKEENKSKEMYNHTTQKMHKTAHN